jgi:membrane-bound lytic murein transglycosylase D
VPALALAAPATPGADTLFPRLPALEPQVAFWTRVYSVYTTSQAVIHDSEQLDVIYSVVDLPPDTSTTDQLMRRERVKRGREEVIAVLDSLAGNLAAPAPSVLTREVKRAWGARGNPAVWAAAKDRVRAQIGQADRFRAGVVRSGAYLPHMTPIMEELGVPIEILALPHVESSFNPEALSHRGACGIWQWTRPTGRKYMRIDRLVDERRDPLLATRAAGRMLGDYYREFGSWPIAITAYNHGIQGMRKAYAAHGTDFAAIVQDFAGPAFKFASRNFYTEFLAALDVARNYERHFGPLAPDSPLDFDTVTLAKPVTMKRAATLAGMDVAALARLNPALLSPVVTGAQSVPAGYELRVPDGRGIAVAQGIEGAVPRRSPAAAASREALAEYRVRAGDTLTTIARRFNTDVDSLLAMNKLRSDHIEIGQKLVVPSPTSMND